MKTDSLIQRIGGAILVLLGFSACSKLIDAPTEYGTPNATYRISGSVMTKSGDPIGSVQVALKFVVPHTEDQYLLRDTLYSDSSGRFAKEVRVFPVSSIKMTFSDIDGEQNGGEYQSQTVSVTPVMTEKGNGHWYEGAYNVKYDAVLERKGE